jgi:SCY1-like protein 1
MANTALPAVDAVSTTNPSSTQPVQPSDSSWAGWAISSFTNRMATARGEIQPSTTSVARSSHQGLHPISPPPSSKATPGMDLPSPLPSPGHAPHSSIPLQSPELGDEISDDAFQAWDAIGEEEDAFFDAPSRKRTPNPLPEASHRDNVEPDFAGWLAAQSQAKSKKLMPKGLTKSSNLRPSLTARTISTNSVASKASAQKTSNTSKSKVASPVKKIDTAPIEAESAEAGWGEDWE